MLCGIEEQVSRANQYRESQLKVKVQVETEVSPSFLQPTVTPVCVCGMNEENVTLPSSAFVYASSHMWSFNFLPDCIFYLFFRILFEGK